MLLSLSYTSNQHRRNLPCAPSRRTDENTMYRCAPGSEEASVLSVPFPGYQSPSRVIRPEAPGIPGDFALRSTIGRLLVARVSQYLTNPLDLDEVLGLRDSITTAKGIS
jgi:hypothetical protein